MRESKIYTFTEITSNNRDYFQTLHEECSQEDAIYYALSEMRYACSTDFTHPAHCRKGTTVSYFNANGYELPEGMDEEDFAEEMGWEYAVVYEVGKKKIAFAPDYEEEYDHHSITSDEVREYNSWDEVKF